MVATVNPFCLACFTKPARARFFLLYWTLTCECLLYWILTWMQRNQLTLGVACLQGSNLSSMLCSLYLAHLEAHHLVPLLPNPLPNASLSTTTSSSAGLTDLANHAGETFNLDGALKIAWESGSRIA